MLDLDSDMLFCIRYKMPTFYVVNIVSNLVYLPQAGVLSNDPTSAKTWQVTFWYLGMVPPLQVTVHTSPSTGLSVGSPEGLAHVIDPLPDSGGIAH